MLLECIDKVNCFLGKMKNWQRKIESGNRSMLCNVSSLNKEVPATLQTVFRCHISKIIIEFQRYFPEVKENLSFVVRNPFLANVSCIPDENDRLQSKLIDLKCDLSAK